MSGDASPEPKTGPTPGSRVKVVLIVGVERSGSTITGSLLSQLDGWFGGGEIRRVWHDLATEETLCGCQRAPWECEIWASIGPRTLHPTCGCGRPLRECPVWPVAAARALAAVDAGLSPVEVVELQRRFVRYQHSWRALPGLLRQRRRRDWPELLRYVAVTNALFGAVAELTGSTVVVDTSKEPTDAVVLSMCPDVDLYLLHLVRDPRGILYSTYRRPSPVVETGVTRPLDPSQAHPRLAGYVTAHWTIQNGSIAALTRGRHARPLLRIAYEDFVAHPEQSIADVARFVGERPSGMPDVAAGSVSLRPTHTVTGNRSRFQSGAVGVSADADWVTNLHPTDRAISTTLALPLLRRYGYAVRPRGEGTSR